MTDDRNPELDEEEDRDVDAEHSASKEPVTEDPDAPDSTDAEVDESDDETSRKAVDDDAVEEMAEESEAYPDDEEK